MRKRGLVRRIAAVAGLTWLASQIFLSTGQYIRSESMRELAWTALIAIAAWGVITLIAGRMNDE